MQWSGALKGLGVGERRTFEEFTAINLTGGNLESNDVTLLRGLLTNVLQQISRSGAGLRKGGVEIGTYLRLVQQLDRDADCARHGVSDNRLISWVSQRPRGSLE